MRFVKPFCFAACFAVFAAGGLLSQPRLPGRVVGQREADTLVGGGCVTAATNQCGIGAGCTGTDPCVKVTDDTQGGNNPYGTYCTDDPLVCTIFFSVGVCSKKGG